MYVYICVYVMYNCVELFWFLGDENFPLSGSWPSPILFPFLGFKHKKHLKLVWKVVHPLYFSFSFATAFFPHSPNCCRHVIYAIAEWLRYNCTILLTFISSVTSDWWTICRVYVGFFCWKLHILYRTYVRLHFGRWTIRYLYLMVQSLPKELD